MRHTLAFLVLLVSCGASDLSSPMALKYQKPDSKFTPGSLCTDKDDYFDGYRYREHIAHCARNVTKDMKLEISAYYGIVESDWPQYEFDHWYPLGIGGSTDIDNVFPQPIEEAKLKDVLESTLYQKISSGEITQKEAINQINKW